MRNFEIFRVTREDRLFAEMATHLLCTGWSRGVTNVPKKAIQEFMPVNYILNKLILKNNIKTFLQTLIG